MRKFTELLRLRFELGLSQDQIARSCSISQASVSKCLKRMRAAGVSWPLPEGWDEARLEETLFGHRLRRYETRRPTPDFAHLHQELQSNRHLTLQLLWEEYRQNHPEGFGYSRFCELYHGWHRRLDVVLRHEHKAGEKLFVDYAGDTVPIHDPKGGPDHPAFIFVAVLGASNYTYAEATWSQGLEDWLGAHVRSFEFLAAVPRLVVPDNARAGVSRACRYEPDLNPACLQICQVPRLRGLWRRPPRQCFAFNLQPRRNAHGRNSRRQSRTPQGLRCRPLLAQGISNSAPLARAGSRVAPHSSTGRHFRTGVLDAPRTSPARSRELVGAFPGLGRQKPSENSNLQCIL
jgi:transposase